MRVSERTNKRERGGGKAQACFNIGPSTFTFCLSRRELKELFFLLLLLLLLLSGHTVVLLLASCVYGFQ